MKRGILINLAALFLLGLLVLAPALIMLAAGGMAEALGCEMSGASPGGPPPCDALLAVLLVTGYSAIAIVPITVGILGLYLLGVLAYFLFSLLRSRRNGTPLSRTALGMALSTLAVLLAIGCLAAVFAAVTWYRVSFVSACQTPPGELQTGGVQNGLLLLSARQPGAPPESYVILSASPQGGAVSVLADWPGSSGADWSPDGAQIAYVSETPFVSGRWSLFSMTAAGEPLAALYESSFRLTQPDWSPDGARLLYNQPSESDPGAGQDLFVLDLQSGARQALTSDEAFDGSGRFSPDGSQVVFVSERDNNTDIYLMNADGTNLRRLTLHPGRDIDPAWSPDGQWIVFASSRQSESSSKLDYDLYSMSPDGSNQCRLTKEAGVEWAPVWSPDGRWIAYIKLGEARVYLLDLQSEKAAPLELDYELTDIQDLDWAVAR